jgi:dihydroxy-acid dehydratase
MGAAFKRGELSGDDLELAQRGACPTCGACQFMGSAATGQVLAEALGLALPGSALVPQPLTKLLRYARAAGKQVLRLLAEDITARRILTREAFENAIVIHAAIGGSTNALLHLPVIAQEAGVAITIDDCDRIHRDVPVLANVKSTGRYPVEYFWYAGGVPAVMLELRDMLHLDCLTVTGRTLGENLEEIEHSKWRGRSPSTTGRRATASGAGSRARRSTACAGACSGCCPSAPSLARSPPAPPASACWSPPTIRSCRHGRSPPRASAASRSTTW